MTVHKSVTLPRVLVAIQEGGYPGFCVACGVEADGVDPDACGDECEECGAAALYGAEELLISIV